MCMPRQTEARACSLVPHAQACRHVTAGASQTPLTLNPPFRTGCLAFGHSGGGLAAAIAEARRPGTFAALYLYEPVIFRDGSDRCAPHGPAGSEHYIGAHKESHFEHCGAQCSAGIVTDLYVRCATCAQQIAVGKRHACGSGV